MLKKRFLLLVFAIMSINLLAFAEVTVSNFKVKFGEDIYGSDPNRMRVLFDIDVKNQHGQHCMAALAILDENGKYLTFKGHDRFKDNNSSFFKQEGFWSNIKWTQPFDISKQWLTFLPATGKVRFRVFIYVTENGRDVIATKYTSDLIDLNQGFANVANVPNAKKVTAPIASSSSTTKAGTQKPQQSTASQKGSVSGSVSPSSIAASMPKLELTKGIAQVGGYVDSDKVVHDLGDLKDAVQLKSIVLKGENGVITLTINYKYYDIIRMTWSDDTEKYKLPSSAKFSSTQNIIRLTGMSSPGIYPASGVLKNLELKRKQNGDYVLTLFLTKVYGESEDYFRISQDGKKVWDYFQTLHSKRYF